MAQMNPAVNEAIIEDVAEPMNETTSTMEQSAESWWGMQRRDYNEKLISLAPWAFMALLFTWLILGFRLPCLAITFYSIFIGALCYIAALPLANMLYKLGAMTENRIKPQNVSTFRKQLYKFWTWFSVFLIFSPAIGNLIWAVIAPSAVRVC